MVNPVTAPRLSRENFTIPTTSPTKTSFENGEIIRLGGHAFVTTSLESRTSSVKVASISSLL